MISTIYIEEAVAEHPRTLEILARLPEARRVSCERYGQVFNPAAQNFRLQKVEPALILASKHDGLVLEAPAGYGIGAEHNFYFSHMLNCPYDCRYCFLQGMYRSANYLLFVNYEDFGAAIDSRLSGLEGDAFFFSGYDGDSLAFDAFSGFCDHFLPFFGERLKAWLELRTKSARVQPLLQHQALENVVVAYSFTPPAVHQRLEGSVPSVDRRIECLRQLGERGWPLGLRFDPLIWWDGYQDSYRDLFESVFSSLAPEWIHSVSLGTFRMPQRFFDRMTGLYPEERLFAGPLERRDGMASYKSVIEEEMFGFCSSQLERFVPPERFFPCAPG
jgi:spore photoproduct lyase